MGFEAFGNEFNLRATVPLGATFAFRNYNATLDASTKGEEDLSASEEEKKLRVSHWDRNS
jgi:hypothetical protein